MMVGNRYYSGADMMRMQRDAEDRVREMQERARQTAQESEGDIPPMPSFVNPNRNWSPNPNGRRGQNRPQNRNNQPRQQSSPVPEPPPQEEARHSIPEEPIAPPPPPAPNATTLVEDIVGRLGLESDTLLIIGLILILINQKADTTIILALVYLLF